MSTGRTGQSIRRHARTTPAGPAEDRRHAGGGDHRPRRDRHPRGDGLPPERALALRVPGQGPDLTLAKVSGIMEAAEAWHAEHVLLPLRLATYGELRSVATGRRRRATAPAFGIAVPPRPLAPVGRGYGRVHRRTRLGALRVRASRLPRTGPSGIRMLPFDRHGPRGRQPPAGGGEPCALRGRRARRHARCGRSGRRTTGPRAGSTWKDRRSRCCRGLLDAFERAGVGVVVDDLTTDVGLPVLSATIVDRNGGLLRRLPASSGYGCHPDRGVALARALAEAAQRRLTLIAGSRDDCPPAYYRRLTEAKAIATQVSTAAASPPGVLSAMSRMCRPRASTRTWRTCSTS